MEKHIILARKFCQGEYEVDIDGALWMAAFKYILKNYNRLFFSKEAIHTLWTVNGGCIRGKIKDDQLLLSVLIISLPGYTGKGLTLFRGECSFLYEEKKLGFCWTPDRNVAMKFASGLNAIESDGVLLQAYAPPPSILAGPNDHSIKQMQEFEYTCNPALLENVKVLGIFRKRK
jgi:hypothetical protein